MLVQMAFRSPIAPSCTPSNPLARLDGEIEQRVDAIDRGPTRPHRRRDPARTDPEFVRAPPSGARKPGIKQIFSSPLA
ncbi:hypothetical protein [Methylobacterium sp. ap11]|uniref:hypothetical protein n=1 Tax=Methylobacterium sp. ap11 TaxID=1761799 RepID=UPI00116055C5|nr:hypothetical protein [Methylobacterium sp. ap11]